MAFLAQKSYKGSNSNNMSFKETQQAITGIKDYFQKSLAGKLNLIRVTAPLFVRQSTGLNDNLNGVEKPVAFRAKDYSDDFEIVQSLAKWKRTALRNFKFKEGEGLYTIMNAIRKDEDVDSIHSIYVDQWDWELVIGKQQRTIEFLKEIVIKIYEAIKDTKKMVDKNQVNMINNLPDKIFFITSQELEDRFKNLSPKEREHAIAKNKGAVFLIKIGGALLSGQSHDNRAPDYDDWELNGDIILWNEVMQKSLEISSMGIRVDKNSLQSQCQLAGATDRLKLEYHQQIINDKLPLTIGGGIGQSRLCMYLLEKKHIGEVQCSVWPTSTIEECKKNGINLIF